MTLRVILEGEKCSSDVLWRLTCIVLLSVSTKVSHKRVLKIDWKRRDCCCFSCFSLIGVKTKRGKSSPHEFESWIKSFSKTTHVGRSCIFGGFFRVSRYGIVNQLLSYQSLASVKSLFWFSLTNEKFSLNVCLFLDFLSLEIRRRISSDNHRSLVYHVISFIQWESAEIIRWVINILIIHHMQCALNLHLHALTFTLMHLSSRTRTYLHSYTLSITFTHLPARTFTHKHLPSLIYSHLHLHSPSLILS